MAGKQWTEDELMMVLGVYCRLTFGQLSQKIVSSVMWQSAWIEPQVLSR